ncbi:MAG: hypothetical protein HY275_17865 [Gemmatimonadetes bacterium]|nr:hypothetical protein [Gemmatimonadota bacterium]
MPPATAARTWWFRLVAVGAAAAALHHLLAALHVATVDDGPTWRHFLFVGIDAALVPLLLRRPRWLVWPLALLAGQQVVSHGRRAVAWWQAGRGLDLVSIIVIVGLVVSVWLLATERDASSSASS